MTTTQIPSGTMILSISAANLDAFKPGPLIMRRDPSDIIRANGRYYVWYTRCDKGIHHGYDGTLWYASSPDGPWTRVGTEPLLLTSADPEAFDSMRVDDTVMITREGRYWLYYKGRQWDRTPAQTKLGVAVASRPEGPYVKHADNPVISAGHEVMAWPLKTGVVALINQTGPEELRQTIQYAGDGVHFQKIGQARSVPHAAGFYRPEAFTGSGKGTWPAWGIQITDASAMMPTINRFDCKWTIL